MVVVTMRIKGVKRVRAKGRIYHYDRISGKRIEAEPHTQAFLDEVKTLRAGKEPDDRHGDGTWGALVKAYLTSPKFTDLAPSTKADYLRVIEFLKVGNREPVKAITRGDVRRTRDAAFKKHKRRFANYVVQVFRLILAWGVEYEWLEANPGADVPLLVKPKTARKVNRAWTEDELRIVLKAAAPEMRTPIALGGFAAYRRGDALSAPWTAYSGSRIKGIHRKNGAPIDLPAHSMLAEILDAERERQRALSARKKVACVTIVAGQRGRPLTGSGFASMFFKLIRKLTDEGKVGPGLSFHGLRHTAATMLADAGCDTRDIMAVTGHKTEAMVQHYTQAANQRTRADRAIKKLERHGRKKWKTGLEN